MDIVAAHNWTQAAWDAARRTWPARPNRALASGRAILERAVVHLPDVELDREYDSPEMSRTVGFRSILAVPMMRDDKPIGVILVGRAEPGRFSDTQIDLLKTFADQAVIAIENVRLFTQLQEKNNALTQAHAQVTESLEQQTATAEILRVISQSPTDVQPVFDAIVRSAVRLCGGVHGGVLKLSDGVLSVVAHENLSPINAGMLLSLYPTSPDRAGLVGLAVRNRDIVHSPDVQRDPRIAHPELARRAGYSSVLAVPIMRSGEPIGAIFVTATTPFAAPQLELLKTFADQAVIAIENVRLFQELEEKNRTITEALEQQTTTSEILQVISGSPTNIQPVFDTIVQSAARLCDGMFASLHRFDGQLLHWVAQHNYTAEGLDAMRKRYPMPADRDTASGRAVFDRAVIHVRDFESDPDVPPSSREIARAFGYRSLITVPMLREGQPVGAIAVARQDGPFSQAQIKLLQTFADQAVIAIENVRLFKELETRNAALTETLARQTATGEVLRAISRAQTDAQPVFDIIASSAMRLCGANFNAVTLYDGELLHLAALTAGAEALRAAYPRRADGGHAAGRAIQSRAVVHIPDVLADRAYELKDEQQAVGFRSILAVPMLRDGVPIGVLSLGRHVPGSFSDSQIDLLQTFADQAVIAIENVRLFTELQTSNRDLTTALDTQTATSDILRVISRSQTDVQPVFDAILASAVRLLGAYSGALTRIAGDQIELAALKGGQDAGAAAAMATFPQSLQSERPIAQAIRDRAPVNISDAQTDPRVPEVGRANARARGFRSWVAVPLLLHDEAVGAIAVNRREPGGFTDDEIALLKTFADQAVIAIENARLLTELQTRTAELTRSVGELTALGEVGRALSSTLDLETVLQTIVLRANELAGTAGCTIWEYDEAREQFRLRVSHYTDESDTALLQALGQMATIPKGPGVTTQVVERRQPVQIPDITAAGAYEHPIRGPLIEAGHRALLGVPLLSEDEVIGVLTVTRKAPGEFPPETVRLLQTFATQSALAIQNARLFREIEIKSRELEVASQHKSEFLANMSHELRTPLNAIIGFSEVLTQRMFGDLNEKQEEYLKDIYASGQHLLSLINDILDLSKIEAGRMELELTDFDLPTAVDNALTLVRERAGRRGIALHQAVDQRLGQIRGDERKIKQVLLNLLSNALKFTPEGGRVDVRATVSDGTAEVSVSDTGVGIAPEDQEVVFEEFRQVGTADKKVEGTGLGLALSRKFIELHGGRIWVQSQLDVGSTFTFRVPVRRGE
jgi:GAF domain-containing protein